jgi:hypothetical protein
MQPKKRETTKSDDLFRSYVPGSRRRSVQRPQHAVAAGLDDAPAMLGDLRMDQLTSMSLQLRERSFLVGTRHASQCGHWSGSR